ncbi:hypothetical protein [Streptomyces sp. NPDC006270]|uniref:hypothetical protein n=1 Tax=Streptomyces sp. NPDC006270 TaxID=3364741 RepID=UPI00368718D8
MAHLRTAVFRRSPATVTDGLDAPPEPPIVQDGHRFPERCLFSPERATGRPDLLELDKRLRGRPDGRSNGETIDPAHRNAYAYAPGGLYPDNLSSGPAGRPVAGPLERRSRFQVGADESQCGRRVRGTGDGPAHDDM